MFDDVSLMYTYVSRLVAYTFVVGNVNFLIIFEPNLYECPEDNFGSKDIGKFVLLIRAWTTVLLLYKTTSTFKETLTNEVELQCKDVSATVSNRLNTTSI